MSEWGLKYIKPHIKIFLCSLFLSTTIHSQTKSFIKKYRFITDSLSHEYKIPVSIILGVSIIESSSGTSKNCKLLNNFFGIVGKNSLLKSKGIRTRYKQYKNDTASFADFCKLLTRKKFYSRLKGNKNYKVWLDAISKSGYSEAPEVWKHRISSAIRKHELADYDKSLIYE